MYPRYRVCSPRHVPTISYKFSTTCTHDIVHVFHDMYPRYLLSSPRHVPTIPCMYSTTCTHDICLCTHDMYPRYIFRFPRHVNCPPRHVSTTCTHDTLFHRSWVHVVGATLHVVGNNFTCRGCRSCYPRHVNCSPRHRFSTFSTTCLHDIGFRRSPRHVYLRPRHAPTTYNIPHDMHFGAHDMFSYRRAKQSEDVGTCRGVQPMSYRCLVENKGRGHTFACRGCMSWGIQNMSWGSFLCRGYMSWVHSPPFTCRGYTCRGEHVPTTYKMVPTTCTCRGHMSWRTWGFTDVFVIM